MLGPGAILRTGSGRQDRQVAIDLRAVGVDDRSACRFRQPQRQCRLAACGRTGNEGDRRLSNLGHCDADSSRTARRKTAELGAGSLAGVPPCPLDRSGRCGRPRNSGGPIGSAFGALKGWEGVDIIPLSAGAARKAPAGRRHGFDHDRAGMHRRTGRLCGREAAGRRNHGTGDAGRTGFRRGAQGAGGVA